MAMAELQASLVSKACDKSLATYHAMTLTPEQERGVAIVRHIQRLADAACIGKLSTGLIRLSHEEFALIAAGWSA